MGLFCFFTVKERCGKGEKEVCGEKDVRKENGE
jgi:hypothetical protein